MTIINEINLEGKIREEVERKRIDRTIARDEIPRFGDLTKDYNPVHRQVEIATKFGFQDTPVMGAYTSAIVAQYIKEIIDEIIRPYHEIYTLSGQKMSFKSPLYPGEKLTLSSSYQGIGKNGEILLSTKGSVGDRTVIEVSSRIHHTPKEIQLPSNPLFYKDYLITEEDINSFYALANKGSGKRNNPMICPSFVPGTLLELLSQKAGKLEGTNLSMDYNFISDLTPGMLRINIYTDQSKRARKKGDNFLYRFQTSSLQEGRVIDQGEILTASKQEVNLN